MRFFRQINWSTIAKPLWFCVATVVEGAEDTFVLDTVLSFLYGKDEEDSMQLATGISFGITTLAAIPLTLTMMRYWFKTAGKQSIAIQYESTDNDALTTETKPEHEHNRDTYCHKLLDLLVIGAPFGMLAFGGCHYVLHQTGGLPKWLNYSLSTIAGLVSGWGNCKLHSHHVHAQRSLCQLWGEIAQNRKALAKAIGLSIGVVAGHFFQGFLDGHLFLMSINEEASSKIADYSAPLVLAILVTLSEGITELRSTLLRMQNASGYRHVPRISTLIITPAAIIHGLVPTTGVIQ